MHIPLRPPLLARALVCAGLAAVLAWGGAAGHVAAAATYEPPQPEEAPVEAKPAPTLGARAARIALGVVGTRYRYGGESPATGFDCSGLVRWAYGRLGVDLPHSSYALASTGRAVSATSMRVGDVLVFSGLGHVGLYLGRGRMVHAPQSGRTVEVVTLGAGGYGARVAGARRIARA